MRRTHQVVRVRHSSSLLGGEGKRQSDSWVPIALRSLIKDFGDSAADSRIDVVEIQMEAGVNVRVAVFMCELPESSDRFCEEFASCIPGLVEAGLLIDDINEPHPAEKKPAPTGNTGVNASDPQPTAGGLGTLPNGLPIVEAPDYPF